MQRVFALILIASAALGGCRSTLHEAPVHVAQRAEVDGEINNLYRDGRFFFSSQPSEAALRDLAETKGVVKVINLRTEEEMAERVGFDETAALDDLGVRYVRIPLPREGRDAWLGAFTAEMKRTRGPVLIHCGSSSRAGAVWGRYLRVERGFTADAALLRARAAGVRSEELESWVTSPVPREGAR